MPRIEFSEMTNRLHRNLVATAALIIAMKLFDLRIEKAGTLGVEVKNLTTNVLIIILVAILAYHCVAFAVRAFEEYRIWELKVTETQASFYDGGIGTIDLATKLRTLTAILDKTSTQTDGIIAGGQPILSKDEVDKLKSAAELALTYAKRWERFPTITRWRFWIWDIGIAGVISLVAFLFSLSAFLKW